MAVVAGATPAERVAQMLQGMQEIERAICGFAAEHAVSNLEFVWNRGAPLDSIPPSVSLEVIRPRQGNITFTFPSDAIEDYSGSAGTANVDAAIKMILRSLRIGA